MLPTAESKTDPLHAPDNPCQQVTYASQSFLLTQLMMMMMVVVIIIIILNAYSIHSTKIAGKLNRFSL